jgi:predicted Zn-dependent peptidase
MAICSVRSRRRYQDKNPASIASVFDMRQRIGALTGPQIQEAAQTYLNMRDYVKVTLMPERR